MRIHDVGPRKDQAMKAKIQMVKPVDPRMNEPRYITAGNNPQRKMKRSMAITTDFLYDCCK